MAGAMPGWRVLGAVWAGILVVATVAAITMHQLGPPLRRAEPVVLQTPLPLPPPEQASEKAAKTFHDDPAEASLAAPVAKSIHAEHHRITAPIVALMERSSAFPSGWLPHPAPDGRLARIAYAAPAPPVTADTPRIALLLSGFGLSERDSRAALDALPGPVAFAVSAYAQAPASVFDAAREAGHELLASIPMEPLGYPLNDEGVQSLRTGLSPEENRLNLEWALTRTQGAVGATGASDGMRGERFADIAGDFDPVLDEVIRRGLLYVDPRPGRLTARPGSAVRAIDVVIDEQLGRADIDARLQALERSARERGAAIGLAGQLRPVTLERLAAWIATLKDRGFVLVPVSAIVNP